MSKMLQTMSMEFMEHGRVCVSVCVLDGVGRCIVNVFIDSLHYFNVEFDRITDLFPNLIRYVSICCDIIFHFLINFGEDKSKILTARIYVIAATEKIQDHSRNGQNVSVSAVDLHQPLNEEAGNRVVIDERNLQFIWQKVCGRIPVADVHVVACVDGSHSECAARDVDEYKIC